MADREQPAPIYVERLDLREYPPSAPFRLWLGNGEDCIGWLTDPGTGRAVVRRPSGGGFSSDVLSRNPDAAVTIGTRPMDEESSGRGIIKEPGSGFDDEDVEWGHIVFETELVLRLEEGEFAGRIWCTGQAVVGLEPGQVVGPAE